MSTLAEQIANVKLPPMTDEEICVMAGLPKAHWGKYIATITSDERTFYEQTRAIEILLPLWIAGVEPYPSDVSVNRGPSKKPSRLSDAPTEGGGR